MSNVDKIISFLYVWLTCKRKDNEKNLVIYRFTLINTIMHCMYNYALFTFEQFRSGMLLAIFSIQGFGSVEPSHVLRVVLKPTGLEVTQLELKTLTVITATTNAPMPVIFSGKCLLWLL